MQQLPLTIAFGPNEHMEPLRDGLVQPQGIDLSYRTVDPVTLLVDRMVKEKEYHVSEMFLALYFTARSQGAFPFVAMPIFPSRAFRHSNIFINTNSGIREAKDLQGKRVGLPEYRQTASVWIKGILQHDYGVDLTSIQWFEGGYNDSRPRDEMDIAPAGPISLEFISETDNLNSMLERGDLDALIGAGRPASFGVSPHVQRLFADYPSEERDYYRRTGLYPIMHTLVVQESVYQEQPWVAHNIYQAACQSKETVWSKLRSNGSTGTMAPWGVTDIAELDGVFGADPWPNGLEANRANLETLMGYLVEQGLLPAAAPIDDLFVSVEQPVE